MANIPARACPLAKKCGGCQLQNLSYDEQLHLKQATAIRLLGRFGHVEEIIGMKDPYHYRKGAGRLRRQSAGADHLGRVPVGLTPDRAGQ